MPLIRFEIRNEFGLGDTQLYRSANKDDPRAILDGVAVSGLVGILRQLGDLAEFAAEVFHDLHEQVTTTAARSHNMVIRVHNIEATLPPLEKAVLSQKSHIHFAYTAGSDWHADIQTDENHLSRSDLPRFITDSYEECRDPPRLFLLDKFDPAGAGACLKRYSDPSIFKMVRASSEPMKAGKEKKANRSKRKGSRHKSVNVSRATSMSQLHSSGRLQFASVDINRQIPVETNSTSNIRSNSELPYGSTPADSNSRLGYIERVFSSDSFAEFEKQEDNSLSKRRMKSSANPSSTSDEHNEEDGDHDSLHGSVQRQGALRSSSVSWDEKAEIVKPSTEPCDDVLKDQGLDSDSLSVNNDPSTVLQNVDQAEIVYNIENITESFSGGNHFEDITSETDNYMDALNTMDSEIETDSECQTKREVELQCNVTSHGVEIEPDQTHEDQTHEDQTHEEGPQTSDLFDVESPIIISSHSSLIKEMSPKHEEAPLTSDSFDVESPIPSHSFLIREMSPNSSNQVPSKSMVHMEPPPLAHTDSNTINSVNSDFCAKLGQVESPAPSCSSLAIENSNLVHSQQMAHTKPHQTGYVAVNTVHPIDIGLQENPNILEKSTINSSEPVNGGLSSGPTIPDSEGDKIAVDLSQSQESAETSYVPPVQIWTNGSLLGLEPSKPPDFNVSSFSKQNSPGIVTAVSETKPEKNEMPSCKIERPPREFDQNNVEASSSISGLTYKFLRNGSWRKASLSQSDASEPSTFEDTEPKKVQEEAHSFELKKGPKKFISQTLSEATPREHFQFGSPSPPLEHMKISFHPMNGLDSTKLKLEFPDIPHIHESTHDLIFPSFQLLPELSSTLHDIDSESDDTFCRSSLYLSDDPLSPRSDSNSEQWESQETNGSGDQEMYDALRKVPSDASISSSLELDGEMDPSSQPAYKSVNCNMQNEIESYNSGPSLGLSSFEAPSSLTSQQEGKSALDPTDPLEVSLICPNELPPPPLPPMQWRIKPQLALENKASGVSESFQPSELQVVESTLTQPTVSVPEPPQIERAAVRETIMKLNGLSKLNQAAHDKEANEKEDLLHQIRTKSYSLRRTVAARPSLVPSTTTSVNVAAILEKANAIRQAVGSDEGGDDENWSDS